MSMEWYGLVLFHMLAIGVIGNLLVIIYFMKINMKKLKKMSSYHFLIILLAFTDLFICMHMFPFIIPNAPFNWSVLFGVLAATFLVLTLLSFERYRNIVHPFKGKIKKRWFLAIYIGTLFVFCSYNFVMLNEDSIWYIILNLLLLFCETIIPLILMVYFYTRINKKIKESQTLLNTNATQQQLLKRNKKAVKTVKCMVDRYLHCVRFPFKDNDGCWLVDLCRKTQNVFFTMANSIVSYHYHFTFP